MSPIVGDVAALDPELDRHGAVAGDGEDEEQLLEVGAMILVMPPGDGRRRLAAASRLLGRLLVGTVEGHGRGVVVEFVEFDGEFADGVGDDRQGQRGDVGVEESIEAASDAVVVEVDQFVLGEAQPVGDEACGPLADTVERLAGNKQVFQQQEQSGGGGDLGARVFRGQVDVEELLESEPPEDRFEHGQGAQSRGVESATLGLGDLAGSGSGCGSVGPQPVRFRH